MATSCFLACTRETLQLGVPLVGLVKDRAEEDVLKGCHEVHKRRVGCLSGLEDRPEPHLLNLGPLLLILDPSAELISGC
jgi:hypothetical protein